MIGGGARWQPTEFEEPDIASEIQQLQDLFMGVGVAPSATAPASDRINTDIPPSPPSPEAPPHPPLAATLNQEEIEDTGSANLPAAASFQLADNASFIDRLEAIAVPASDFLKTDNSNLRSNALDPSAQPQEIPHPLEPPARQLPLPPMPAGAYLDSQERYQLLEPLPPRNPSEIVGVPVLDCQPLQISLLNALLVAKSEIPAIAQPYLSLKWQFPQNLPAIHDAWQTEIGQRVVLIEDCGHWPKLLERWSDPQLSTQQILYWLQEMVELWTALEPCHCRQSLLEMTNLRVNPEETNFLASIRLQRLYSEPVGSSLTLQDLGQVWQALFDESQRTQFSAVAALVRDLHQGEIQTVDELRPRLESTQMELEPELTPISAPTRLQLGKSEEPILDAADTTTLTLPMQVYRLEDCGRTHVGRLRDHNEDFFSIWTQINKLESSSGRVIQVKGLYILCDGMGGHAGGEVASQLAVETLKQHFQEHWGDELPSADSICEAVQQTNKAIYEVNQQDARSGSARMGTTLVMALIHNTKLAIAHVGDSRLYCLKRGGALRQITADHEVGMREIKRGVDPTTAYSRPDAYQLTQALGPRDQNFVKPEVEFLEINEDTLIVLTSDGLTDNHLLETHWQTKLEPLLNPQASLEQGVSELIELANQYNGHDNITAIVIRVLVQPGRS